MGGMAASAATTLEFHFNANTNWSGAEAYPTFTDKGQNPDNTSEEMYEFVLNSSNGLGDGDIYFRLHYQGWTDDIAPGTNYTYDFSNANNWGSYHQWHGEVNWSNSNYYCIPQSTVKASEYKITVYAQQENHYNIKVEIVSMPATISPLGYSTFSCAYALDLSGVTAYYAPSTSDNKVVLKKTTGKVPAATGLLLAGSGTVNIPVVGTNDATALDFNYLNASVTAKDITPETGTSDFYYFLAGNSAETIGFYYLNPNGTTYTSGAGKAYLRVNTPLANESTNPSEGRAAWIFQDNTTTAIESVQQTTGAQQYYDMLGRRVAQPTKGLYIVNGKKVIK